MAGTVAGVVAAYGLINLVRDRWSIVATVLFFSALVPHHLQHRYWLDTALNAFLILLAYGFRDI